MKRFPRNSDRRDFIKQVFLASSASLLFPAAQFLTGVRSRLVFGAPALPMVKTDDPIAKALFYNPDAKKADKALMKKKADQFKDALKKLKGEMRCSNCNYFSATPEEKSGKIGKCQLFAGKTVNDVGWCNSWAPKT